MYLSKLPVLKKITFLFLLATVLLSCKEDKKSLSCRTSANDFILKKCLCDQVLILDSLQAGLTKSLAFNHQDDKVDLSTLDSLSWEKELKLFFESDIKKSNADKLYEKEKVCIGPHGSVCHETYTLKKGEKGEVSYLRISTSDQQLDSIEIVSGTNNYLYKGDKLLHLYFKPLTINEDSTSHVLSAVSVRASHDVVVQGKADFEISAAVEY